MCWYCYHNRKCLTCGNVFKSEYDTLLMVNDRHLLCNNCGSYNSISDDLIENDNLNENSILKNYDISESRSDYDLNLQIMNTGHSGFTTFHCDTPYEIVNRLKTLLLLDK